MPVAIIAAILIVAVGSRPRLSAQANDAGCNLTTTERIVAVGDIHGAFDKFAAILRVAGLTDRRDRWIGGQAWLVQSGDVLDRGADSRRAVDLLRRLERDAPRSGGRVYSLLGNHEFMRLAGDWRYVSAGELKAFQTGASGGRRQQVYERLVAEAVKRAEAEKKPFDEQAYREQFLRDVPLGFIEMRQAFDATGEYGAWVRARPAMIKVNGIVFMHGGVSPEVAPLGCTGINAAVRRDLASLPVPADKLASLLSASDTGPLWYRGLASEREPSLAPALGTILQQLGARAIVIGHTPVVPGRITVRFGGQVIQIDTGMLDGTFFPGGVPSALEIRGDAFTAIYEDRREPLAVPALSAAPISR